MVRQGRKGKCWGRRGEVVRQGRRMELGLMVVADMVGRMARTLVEMVGRLMVRWKGKEERAGGQD